MSNIVDKDKQLRLKLEELREKGYTVESEEKEYIMREGGTITVFNVIVSKGHYRFTEFSSSGVILDKMQIDKL